MRRVRGEGRREVAGDAGLAADHAGHLLGDDCKKQERRKYALVCYRIRNGMSREIGAIATIVRGMERPSRGRERRGHCRLINRDQREVLAKAGIAK